MDLRNIKKIMSSNLWRKITRNKNYIDFKIVCTSPRTRSFWMMIVFFNWRISNQTIKRYFWEGYRLSKGESLDQHDKVEFYGTKLLIFS